MSVDRALDLGPLGHEVLGRIDRRPLQLRDRLAGERVDLADPLDLVAPQLDADGLLLVRGEDLDRVAAHAEGALLEGDVVAPYWIRTSSLRIASRPRCSPRSTVTISLRYSTGSPRP